MRPTYSVAEIKLLIKDLDFPSVDLITELVEEEKECFLECELKAIYKFIELKKEEFISSQVKVEFLLSFN